MKRLTIRKPIFRLNKWILLGVLCWNERKTILKLCAIGFMLGLLVIFSIPTEYDAFIFCTPESLSRTIVIGGDESEDFSDGMDATGVRVRDAVIPSRYELVVGSFPFLCSLFNTQVRPILRPEIGTVDLLEYMSDHQNISLWNGIFSSPIRLFNSSNPFNRKTANKGKELQRPFLLTAHEEKIAKAIKKRIKIKIDQQRRTITLIVRMQDPLVAAQVANQVSERLQAYVTDYRNQKEFDTYTYVEELNRQAKNNYQQAQEAYARFADRNQDLARLSAQQEQSRLRTEMNLVYREYVRTSRQLQVAKTRVVKERPVYTVIEPAKVPSKPAAPRKKRILAGIVFIFGLMGCGWVNHQTHRVQ